MIAVVIAIGFCWIAWCVATAACQGESASTRISAAAVTLLWLSTLLFWALSTVQLFRADVAAPLLALGAVVAQVAARRLSPHQQFLRDARRVWNATVPALRSPFGILFAAASAVVVARTFRGLVAPTLAWDDLTYHLLRAGRWVHAAGWTIQPAPNAWGYSEYFPPGGDILWAWTMLAARSDALVVVGNLLIFSAVFVGGYSLVRRFGRSELEAALTAGVIAFTPAAINYMPSGYVEPSTLAMFLLSATFLARLLLDTPRPAEAVLAAAALGLALSIKVSNAIFVLPGLLLLIGRVATARWPMSRRATTTAAIIAAALVSAPFYLRAWLDMGSPSYPIPVEIAGTTLFAGNEWQRLIFSLPLRPLSDDSFFNLLTTLFVPTASTFSAAGQFLNLGPAFLLLAVPGAAGLAQLIKTPKTRQITAYLAICAALVIVSAMSANTVNLRTFFGSSLGRFLLAPAAVVAVFAAGSEWRSRRQFLWIAFAINIALAIPLGWSATDRAAIEKAATGHVRDSLRYNYFSDLAAGATFSVSRDASQLASYWPAWKMLDQPDGLRIAVTGTWGAMSPLGPRYPLLGSHLQNSLEYVPVTTSGEIVDRPDFYANMNAGDYEAWLKRLVDRRIDYLFVMAEPAIEAEWAKRHPEAFSAQPLEAGSAGLLYRVKTTGAAR